MRSIDWLYPCSHQVGNRNGASDLNIPELIKPVCGLVALFLFLPGLLGPGLFLDGMTYAAVSRNMAIGLGTYWDPHYTASLYPHFFEALPLGLILQSWFFQVLGDYFWVEKSFALLTFLGSAVAIHAIWRQWVRVTALNDLECYAWLPVLLLLFVPKVIWSYRNNLLENTVSFYDLLAVYCLIRALGSKRMRWQLVYGFCAALLILGALLCKGPAGLFPLVTAPILGFCGVFPFKKSLGLGSVVWAWFLLMVFGLMQIDFVANFASYFWAEHLAPAVLGNRADGHSFWDLILSLVRQLGPPACLTFLFIRVKSCRDPQQATRLKVALSLCLIGLSASLPLGISQTFRSFYLVPAFPYFCLGLAILTAAHLARSRPTIAVPRGLALGLGIALVFGGGLTFLGWGRPIRDAAYFQHSAILQTVSQTSGVLGSDSAFQLNWQVQALLARYYRISLQTQNASPAHLPYFLHDTNAQIPEGYELTSQYFGPYPLLEKRGPNAH